MRRWYGRLLASILFAAALLARDRAARADAAPLPAPSAEDGRPAKAAPADARLRERRRRALDRRARQCEARAAHPPPLPPPTMSDGPQDSATVLIYKDGRWKAQLKREAFEARADAEAARTKPDETRIAELRREATQQRQQEDLLTLLIKREQQKEGADKIEMEKAFQGIGGVDSDMKNGALHAR